MLENPLFNNNPNTGVKGQYSGLTTAKYQLYKLIKRSTQLMLQTFAAVFLLLKDMIKEVVRPGSTRKYG